MLTIFSLRPIDEGKDLFLRSIWSQKESSLIKNK